MTPEKEPSLGGLFKKNSSPPAEEETAESDYAAGEDAASEAILSAIKSGDASALKEALKDLISLCS
jgi:hypothetical protein